MLHQCRLSFALILSCLLPGILSAQHSGINISAVASQNLTLENSLPVDSLSYYPYCTISISIFNFDKLNKKEFRSQSSRLESFVLNAGIQGKSICPDQLNVPVFVVNYEKDKYTQITHQQGVLINKLLVNKDGQDYPTISVFPKTIEKTKNAPYIDALKQVATLLKNSASLNVVASVSNITDAFSQYINGLCTDQESDYEWSFPVVPATDITKPYKVNMFIIKPNSNSYAGQNFFVRNGEAWSESSGNEYTKYPYILVTTSFSAYMADDKLPSTLAIESLDRMSIDASRIKLYSDMGRLSKEQFDAEAQLLDKYESYLKIKDMVSLLPQYATNDDIKAQAINEWLNYRKKECPSNHFFGTDVFANQNQRVDIYTDNLVSQVGFHKSLSGFMDLYFGCSTNSGMKADLATYYKFHDMFASTSFIRNSLIFSNLNTRIDELESVLYQNNYASSVALLRMVLQSDNISDKEKLQKGRSIYNDLYAQITANTCRSCNDSVFKVLALYDQMDNNKEALSRTQDIMNCTSYIDTLVAYEANIDDNIKGSNLKSDKKKELVTEKGLLEKEASSLASEKRIFMSMPIQPKNEFKSERLKVEGDLDDAHKLIEQAKSKS
jgi:hypothetical protein